MLPQKNSSARPAVSSKLARQSHFVRAGRSSNGSWVRGASALELTIASCLWMDHTVLGERRGGFFPALPEVLFLR